MLTRQCQLLLLVAAACSSPPDRQPADLARAMRVSERRSGQADAQRIEHGLVDYESAVLVDPNRDLLSAVVGNGDRARAAHIDALHQRLQRAHETLLPLLGEIKAFDAALRELLSRPHPSTPLVDDPAWQAMTKLQTGLVEALAPAIKDYVSLRFFDGTWDPSIAPTTDAERERFASASERVGETYVRIAPRGDLFVGSELVRFVNQYTAVLRERIATFDQVVEAIAASAKLEMEAEIQRGRERLPVSITPYTVVSGVHRGNKSDRIIVPGKADLERIEANYSAYGRLAAAINDLRKLDGRQAWRDFADRALQTIKAAVDKLEAELNAVIALSKPELQAGIALARELREVAKAIRDDVTALHPKLSDPGALVGGAARLLARVRDDAVPAAQKLAAALSKVGELDEVARPLVDTLMKSLAGAIAELPRDLAKLGGPLGSLWAELSALVSAASAATFAGMEPGQITRRSFALNDLQVGAVNLADTAAEPGDRLRIGYRLLIEHPNLDGTVATQEAQASDVFGVRKFGLYTTFGAQLAFYDRHDDGRSVYQAAPGLSYNIHYRPSSATFWDVVAPGVGLSVLAPSFESGTEMAIGAHVTLFNDLVQVGLARNISVAEKPEMAYFSLDLIQLFQQSGLSR